MITRSAPDWQLELAQAVRSPEQLLQRLGLRPQDLGVDPEDGGFPLRVPESYVGRMVPGDPQDPLLLQVLPRMLENTPAPGFHRDPLAEEATQVTAGVLRKYAGRALLITTAACAIHCRYCFRRHFQYTEAQAGREHWRLPLEHLSQARDVSEVILSGGDPLALSDERLSGLCGALETIPHLRRLRIHTRLPVVLPSRVDEYLCRWLAETRLEVAVVIHANHPREVDESVKVACRRLINSGAVLLNQSVLLRKVNDSPEILEHLSVELFSGGVLPYYLHQLDPVEGGAHFSVSDCKARGIHEALRRRLPGYLVPRLVRELPGMASKTAL